jgi:hypothetical protein
MIELRGGIDCLGGKGFFKAGILGFETLYSFMYRSNPSYPSIEDNSFYRPMYTVKPKLCATITRVPQGLRDLACEQKFSLRSIQLLDEFSHTMNDIAEIREYDRESGWPHSSVLVSEYMASKNDQPSIEKYLVLCCLLYVLEMRKSKYTRAKTEAIFERTFDILMEYFIAYAHQVDLALNGTVSSNIGSLLEVVFIYDGTASTGSPPLLSSSTSSKASPMAYFPDEDNQFFLIETEDQLQIHVGQDHMKVDHLEHEAQEEMPSNMALNEVNQMLNKILSSPKLRRRWSECWQAAKASALGAPGVFPWMLLSDRVICFSSYASAAPGNGTERENGTETEKDEQSLAKEEYARAAQELNMFLEIF